MSSGVMRVLRDSAAAFVAWRKQSFGFELAPLPRACRRLTRKAFSKQSTYPIDSSRLASQ